MRLRLGFALGFGTGYYLGARAGRARYEQINRMVARARGSDAYETAAEKARAAVEEGVEKAKAAVDEGVEKAKAAVEEHRGGNGHHPEDSVASPRSNPSPGPPPAGSLSPDPPDSGGPPPA